MICCSRFAVSRMGQAVCGYANRTAGSLHTAHAGDMYEH